MWWGIYISLCYKFPAESNSERILKIGKYLVKLWARVRCLVFFDSQCIAHYRYGCKITERRFASSKNFVKLIITPFHIAATKVIKQDICISPYTEFDSKTRCPNFTIFSMHVAYTPCSCPSLAARYVLYFRFCG